MLKKEKVKNDKLKLRTDNNQKISLKSNMSLHSIRFSKRSMKAIRSFESKNNLKKGHGRHYTILLMIELFSNKIKSDYKEVKKAREVIIRLKKRFELESPEGKPSASKATSVKMSPQGLKSLDEYCKLVGIKRKDFSGKLNSFLEDFDNLYYSNDIARKLIEYEYAELNLIEALELK